MKTIRRFFNLYSVLLILFIIFSSYPAHATIGSACPGGDSDCDLCAGEICSYGTCQGWGKIPCSLDCVTCEQSGTTTTCVAHDSFCEQSAPACQVGVCNTKANQYFNPTGCEYSHNPQPAQCQACGTCGNGICESPENPTSCPTDCLVVGANPTKFQNPSESCEPLDVVGLPLVGCDDANICTTDICEESQNPQNLGYTCHYQPKACSGSTPDQCCSSACSANPKDSNYDVDCCVPAPSPTPPPHVTPVPDIPGDNQTIPTPAALPEMFLEGSGCQLNPNLAGTSDISIWIFSSLSLLGAMIGKLRKK